MELINFSLHLCALLATAMLLVLASLMGSLRERVFRTFYYLLLLNMAGLLLEVVVWWVTGTSGNAARIIIYAADFLCYVAWNLQICVFGWYLYEYMRLKTDVSKQPFRLIVWLGYISLGFAALAAMLHKYTLLDAQNNYVRGTWYWLSLVCPILVCMIVFVFTLRMRKALNLREFLSLMLYSLTPFFCNIIEAAYPGLWVTDACATFILFFIYINLQVELKEKMHRQELALAESRVAVMLSQIQPHFLYNTLAAIDKLCYHTPKAHEAILAFSEYLRGNMDSLTQKKCIPFASELAHTQQYLWLEQLRFEERLQVVYDIETDAFMVPVLSLQPLVENAVRHGISKVKNGGTVTIQTTETEHSYRITVLDDGAGFAQNALPADGRSHLGLANVRERLAALCGGSVTVTSAPGAGTCAMIEIPKGR